MANNRRSMQKKAVIRQLLLPIFIIVAALLYKPVSNYLKPDAGQSVETITDDTNFTVDYIDVGQGDSTLIRKGDFYMLIDAGNNDKGDDVVSYLKKAGVHKLDLLVGTHPDADHIGGLDDVINSIQVETVYLPSATKTTKTYQDVQNALKSKNLTANMPEIGKNYTYENNVIIRFLSPSKSYTDANNNSIVVQAAYGKNHFLFMGDAEETVEQDLLQQGYDLSCDVLKLGHHGSYTATSEAFLRQADPVYGVISCGKGNSYGHPHAETLARLENEDVQIYRTDMLGTIQATSDGTNVTMSTQH